MTSFPTESLTSNGIFSKTVPVELPKLQQMDMGKIQTVTGNTLISLAMKIMTKIDGKICTEVRWKKRPSYRRTFTSVKHGRSTEPKRHRKNKTRGKGTVDNNNRLTVRFRTIRFRQNNTQKVGLSFTPGKTKHFLQIWKSFQELTGTDGEQTKNM